MKKKLLTLRDVLNLVPEPREAPEDARRRVLCGRDPRQHRHLRRRREVVEHRLARLEAARVRPRDRDVGDGRRKRRSGHHVPSKGPDVVPRQRVRLRLRGLEPGAARGAAGAPVVLRGAQPRRAARGADLVGARAERGRGRGRDARRQDRDAVGARRDVVVGGGGVGAAEPHRRRAPRRQRERCPGERDVVEVRRRVVEIRQHRVDVRRVQPG